MQSGDEFFYSAPKCHDCGTRYEFCCEESAKRNKDLVQAYEELKTVLLRSIGELESVRASAGFGLEAPLNREQVASIHYQLGETLWKVKEVLHELAEPEEATRG